MFNRASKFVLVLMALVLALGVLQAQEADIIIFVDRDSLTIYLPEQGNVNLQGLAIRVVVDGDTFTTDLTRYPNAFGIFAPFTDVPTPLCFRLERSGGTEPLPTDCQTVPVFEQNITGADVFWWDNESVQTTTLAVLSGESILIACPGGQARCGVTYRPPPTPTPLPPTETPIPTNTPVVPPTATPTLAPEKTDLELALERAWAGVESNDEWEPFTQEFDNIEMVLVPVGCFMMGSNYGEDDERPVHERCFDEPFWIDQYEVTNEDFGSVGCSNLSSEPDRPRNCVTWFEARDFCEARDARLPTEAEWEYAARGPDSLVYPWGNTYDAALVIGKDDLTYGETSTAPVGSRPDGASWVGAMDMSGNVWEWTSSLYEGYPDSDDHSTNGESGSVYVLRGGSFSYSVYFLRSAYRNWFSPITADINDGFRCARSY